jgi:hypothetical protein
LRRRFLTHQLAALKGPEQTSPRQRPGNSPVHPVLPCAEGF